ncbi:hypothetical protein Holit_02374 [Hollandina sp. SP2]
MEKTTEQIPQRTKEIVLPSRPVPGRPVLLIPQKQQRVNQKRQQVHKSKVLPPMLLPMPNGVLKVVSPVLQHIIMLPLDLPPHPPASDYLFRVSLVYRFVRYPPVGFPVFSFAMLISR